MLNKYILNENMELHLFNRKLTRKIQEENQPAKRNHDISNKKNKVQKLVMTEFVDAMVPLVFGITFAMAYHGPNATLMKGIKNDYFGDQKTINDL